MRLVLDNAAVLLDNAGSDGQAESGACLFRGEERIKQSLLHFRGNSLPRIGYINHDGGDVSSVKNLLVHARTQRVKNLPRSSSFNARRQSIEF
jgi:hypothetical protein